MASSAETPSDATPSADAIRSVVAAAAEGDAVKLAIDTYEWQSPLEVTDTDDAVEVESPADDSWTRSIYLTAARATYELAFSSIGDPRADLYRYKDGERGDRRGTVEHLAFARDDTTSNADTDGDTGPDVDVAFPEGVSASDVEAVVDQQASGGKAELGDVASALGVSVGRARVLTHALDRYEDDIEEVGVAHPYRGGDRR